MKDHAGLTSPGPRVCLLLGQPRLEPLDNAMLLGEAFVRHGWRAERALLEGLSLADGRVWAAGLEPAESFDLSTFDLLWILGLGPRQGFMDRMQLLALLPTPFVTPPTAILTLHGKYCLALRHSSLPHPPTWASDQSETLVQAARNAGGRLILKPPGASFGLDVQALDADDPELAARAQALIQRHGFALLQRYLPAAAEGEFRVLVAGARDIGSYRRQSADSAGATVASNLHQGGVAVAATPDPRRDTLVHSQVIPWLQRHQIGYAGIDLVGEQVLEVNLVNPGGLGTLIELDGIDRSDQVVRAVLAARGFDCS